MITNATIQRIDKRTGQNGAGEEVFAAGAAIAARCFASQVTNKQRWTLGEQIKAASQVVHFYKSEAARAAIADAPAVGDKLVLQIDSPAGITAPAATTMQVVFITDNQISGPLAHWELFLTKV